LKEQFGDDTATIEFLENQKPATKQAYKHQWRKFLEFTGMTGNQILEDRKNDIEFAWEKDCGPIKATEEAVTETPGRGFISSSVIVPLIEPVC